MTRTERPAGPPTTGPHVAGQPATERLMGQVARSTPTGVPTPTAAQVAVVLHALADHTAITAAMRWAPNPDFEPAATSIGRWLHAVGDALNHQERPTMPEDAYNKALPGDLILTYRVGADRTGMIADGIRAVLDRLVETGWTPSPHPVCADRFGPGTVCTNTPGCTDWHTSEPRGVAWPVTARPLPGQGQEP